MRKRSPPDSLLPPLSRRLSEAEAVSFREDLRSADKEVQSYFRVYYITGLIGVTAWLINPQLKPLKELVVGNDGYNVLVPIIIAFLNSVSTTYLLHKSIEIHEIAQFISYASEAKSGFLSWEEWRRSSVSASRLSRPLYALFLIAVPAAVSGFLLWASWRVLHTPIRNLATQGVADWQVERITTAFWRAKKVWYISLLLHVVPVALIGINIVQVPRLWGVITRSQKWLSSGH